MIISDQIGHFTADEQKKCLNLTYEVAGIKEVFASVP